MNILVTGAAGFIGAALCARLLNEGHKVTGIDNLNDYYSVALKKARLNRLLSGENSRLFRFEKLDMANAKELDDLFKASGFTHVVNMAAQAGVRHSLVDPGSYIHSNIVGFANLLECCRKYRVEHLVYASSSSIYGINGGRPYSIRENTDHPASLYAATKKSGEAMAHAYSHLFGIPATGLRFFTVYGPWGRPDMALYLFTSAILENRPIKVFNHGKLMRDFTYIDDIVESVTRLLSIPARPNPEFDPVVPDPSSSSAPWKIFNIGNNATVALEDFISTIERALGKKAIKEYLPMQPGDVESTWADVADLERTIHFSPATPLEEGVKKYVEWHREYYGGQA